MKNGEETHVLDHGYVRYIEHWGSEERIIEAARMSTNKGFQGWETDEKLLKYLYTHKHMTPFEMAGMVIEVKAPIFVFREWHRHRTQCLAGNSQLLFRSPYGNPYKMPIGDLVRKWYSPAPKRVRSRRDLTEFNRVRIGSMHLHSSAGYVSVIDAWPSGEKPVYRVCTDKGEITASADHLFMTPSGWQRIGDTPRDVMMLIQTGNAVEPSKPKYSSAELRDERWIEFIAGYEVSNLGRVRSWLTTRRGRRETPKLKALVPNSRGRIVVGLPVGTSQVSLLVWGAFIGKPRNHILHLNGNAWDNRLSNLYDGTEADNAADRVAHGSQTRLQSAPVKVLAIKKAGKEETFDISVTGNHAFVANRFVVHNSYNEMSARYIPLPNENYTPLEEHVYARSALSAGAQNRQSAGGRACTTEEARTWLAHLEQFYADAQQLYEEGLGFGIPKELARLVTPVGRYSRMRASTNLRNWLGFLTLRCDENAQWEIRQYAGAVASVLRALFPRTLKLWGES